MNGYLKQSTASQVRTIGPFVDDTDFKTLKNALAIANTDILIKKNGAASAAKNSGGATADGSGGLYALTWDATDTATVGELKYSVKVAGSLVVFGSYFVLEEAVYDALFAASSPGYLQPTTAGRTLDVTATGGAGIDWGNVENPTTSLALTGTTVAATQKVDIETIKTNPVVNGGTITFPPTATLASTTNITAGTITTTTNLTNLPAIPANWITAAGITDGALTAAKFAAGAFDAVWTVAARTLTSFGTLVADVATAVWAAAVRVLTAATNITSTGGTTVTQAGDAFTRLGAPAGASVSADIAAAKADTAAVKVVTDKLDTALENDGGVYRLTTNALEQAPGGGGGALSGDQDAALTRIDRTVKGIATKREQ